ncbi:hypothetical protein O6H91_Y477000 [Diphasiastrum complanatum]|nr:hypothetical protein O6H91_Y477000 [Diphasiastrum complanatum]
MIHKIYSWLPGRMPLHQNVVEFDLCTQYNSNLSAWLYVDHQETRAPSRFSELLIALISITSKHLKLYWQAGKWAPSTRLVLGKKKINKAMSSKARLHCKSLINQTLDLSKY